MVNNAEDGGEPAAPTPRKVNWSEKAGAVGSTLKSVLFGGWVSSVVSAAVGLLVLMIVVRYVRAPKIVLNNVDLPPALAAMNASALTHRLADDIDSVKRDARPSPGQQQLATGGDITAPDVSVPMTGLTLPKLLELIDDALGRNTTRVTWEVSALGVGSNATWIVSAHLPGRASHRAPFDPANPDPALAAIARGVLGDVEPLILARALLYDGHCDAGREIAQRLLGREATRATDQSAAINFLGFAAECPDPLVGVNASEAMRFYRAAIAEDPKNGLPRANLGRMLAIRAVDSTRSEADRRADLDSMRSEFATAARLMPKHAGIEEAWGWALLHVQEPDSAIPHLQRAIELEPRLAPVYFTEAEAYHETGKLQQSIASYALGIARQSTDITALKAYGHELIFAGEWESAASAFARAARLDSSDFDTKFYLGCALRHTDSATAVPLLESVMVHYQGPESGYYRVAARAISSDTVSCT